MTGAAPLAVELKDVRKHFGPVQAVRDVDVSIASGEIVAMLGPNGAGKTSTIDIILGLSRQTSGQALVFGMHPRQAVTRGLVSAVMQTGGLLKDLTVKETVQYTASLFAQSKPTAEVLDRAGITQIADRRVGKCSGGEQQRLRFAMAPAAAWAEGRRRHRVRDQGHVGGPHHSGHHGRVRCRLRWCSGSFRLLS